MDRAFWGSPLLLLLILPSLTVAVHIYSDEWEVVEEESLRDLVNLSDQNFEHDTQAATGQTTGAWIVLFTDHQCKECKIAGKALLEATAEQQPIPAQVNVLESPRTRKRFLINHVPKLRLFRDRRMFGYKGDWNAASIRGFIHNGWKNAEAKEVPPEPSAISEYFDDLSHAWQSMLEYFGRRPGLLAGIGAILATAAYTVTLRILGFSSRRRKSVNRSSRKVKKPAD